jgi:hypothetical protein
MKQGQTETDNKTWQTKRKLAVVILQQCRKFDLATAHCETLRALSVLNRFPAIDAGG